MKNPPITWNQRLNAWDGLTLEAFQERVASSRVIHAELAQLFADTMQWGQTHPFAPEHLGTLMNCWRMLVLGSNVPWITYDNDGGKHFLSTLAASAPHALLHYLDKRVHARLRDREESAAWIAQALHAACHVDAQEAAPVLEALSKTWSGDLRRSPAFAQELGKNAIFFPWEKMQALHTKFHAYPAVQHAMLQWDGVCTAERLYKASESGGEAGPFELKNLFENASDTPDFHAHALSLNVAGAYLHWRWGLNPSSASNPSGYTSVELTSKVKNAIEATRDTLFRAMEKESDTYPTSLLQAAATWAFDGRLLVNVFEFNASKAELFGRLPEFRQALQEHVLDCLETGNASVPLLELLKKLDPALPIDCSSLMAATAMVHLQDFAHDPARAIVSKEDVPFLASLLRGQEIEELAVSEDVDEQMLFWQLLCSPEWLDTGAVSQAIQLPGVQRALLLATLVEGHGVEHWGIAADHDRRWLTALSRWYPEHAPAWESAQRETLRSSTYRSQPMMEALFRIQGISNDEWAMLSQLVEPPALSLTPQYRKMVLSDVRSLSIGMPIIAQELAWVADTLRSSKRNHETLELPALELRSGEGL